MSFQPKRSPEVLQLSEAGHVVKCMGRTRSMATSNIEQRKLWKQTDKPCQHSWISAANMDSTGC